MTVRHDDVVGRLVRADRSMVPGHMGGTVRSASLVRDRGDLAGQAVAVPAPAAGGGGQIPTLLVAASNATQAVKDVADYVCDGTGDQAEWNSAIAAAPTGRIVGSEGTFHLSGSITIPDTSGISIVGLGRAVTTFRLANGAVASGVTVPVFTRANLAVHARFADFTVDGNKANNGGVVRGFDFYNGSARFERVQIKDCSAHGILHTNSAGQVNECEVTGCGPGMDLGSDGWHVRDSVVSNNTGTGISTRGGFASVVGCVVNSNTDRGIDAGNDCIYANNRVIGNTNYGLVLGGSRVVAVGNYVGNSTTGIYVDGVEVLCSGNTVLSCGGDGLYLFNSDEGLMVGNLIRRNGGWGINITANSDRNTLNSNVITGNTTGQINDGGTNTVQNGNRTT